jgi:hypothetical protein
MVGVPVVDFAPKTDLCAKNVFLVVIVLDVSTDVLIVKVKPCDVISVTDTEVVANPHIEVEWAIV